jgi:hypothetical protein
MTAICYPDCEATSNREQFTLEARSPQNGTILHRDGRKVSENEFGFKYREHQSEFRYRLLDNARPHSLGREARRVVWERWQTPQEDSPHELVVSDDGSSVIRTHGFRPEVIVVAADGRDILRVHITGPGSEHKDPDQTNTSRVFVWSPEQLVFSTAGLYWTAHSWRYFFRHGGVSYFVWRASWGQRLVIDLARAVVFPDEQQASAGLIDAIVAAEKQGVTALLGDLSRRMNEVQFLLKSRSAGGKDERHPLLERVRRVSSALHLVGVHHIRECLPFLREWEDMDLPFLSMGTDAMSEGWSLETQYFRPIVHHSLKLLGNEPRGFPTYHFTNFMDNTRRRFEMPARIPDRRERTRRIGTEMSAEDVLRLLGSPDFVKRWFPNAGTSHCRVTEMWEYDFRTDGGWVTWRITWEERNRRGHIVASEEVAPYWLQSNEREQEYLRM